MNTSPSPAPSGDRHTYPTSCRCSPAGWSASDHSPHTERHEWPHTNRCGDCVRWFGWRTEQHQPRSPDTDRSLGSGDAVTQPTPCANAGEAESPTRGDCEKNVSVPVRTLLVVWTAAAQSSASIANFISVDPASSYRAFPSEYRYVEYVRWALDTQQR